MSLAAARTQRAAISILWPLIVRCSVFGGNRRERLRARRRRKLSRLAETSSARWPKASAERVARRLCVQIADRAHLVTRKRVTTRLTPARPIRLVTQLDDSISGHVALILRFREVARRFPWQIEIFPGRAVRFHVLCRSGAELFCSAPSVSQQTRPQTADEQVRLISDDSHHAPSAL